MLQITNINIININGVGAKHTVDAQFVIAENMISVGHWVIPSSRGLLPHCSDFGMDFKPRYILATHAFDLVGINRSWHSIEGGSEIFGVERVSVTNRYPECKG